MLYEKELCLPSHQFGEIEVFMTSSAEWLIDLGTTGKSDAVDGLVPVLGYKQLLSLSQRTS
jgi:hypothetical protein